ncbi:hypothetical protein Ciccas_003584 [Cichlidogyrus casuarinus]|uniref:Uncharacterized protein n=1 Tax=Cichlidogyrus casuarinus TaxID=1844966 RepID=A0ABD2QG76_9PLAT
MLLGTRQSMGLLLLIFLLKQGQVCFSVDTPVLPVRYFTNFTLYYTSRDDPAMPIPPWPNGPPPSEPYVVGRGATWYAWDLQIAVEAYEDFCVPVFDPPPYFPCMIFNYKDTAYLVTPPYVSLGPCCVYRPKWSAPHRDFMKTFAQYFDRTTRGFGPGIMSQEMDWWIIPNEPDSDDPNHKYFGGYGWARKPLPSGSNQPINFWYEGTIGWAQQIFYDFVESGPRTRDLDVFTLPKECATNITCLYQP